MLQEANVKMRLTIDQIAEILKQLSSRDVAVLEEILDKNTATEVLKRSKDPKKKFLSHEEMVQNFS
jgi:Mg/Co/Ni transporter MgtE